MQNSDFIVDTAVIMSVYRNDRIEYLKESVESIMNQTYRKFLFFIAVDGPISESCNQYLSDLNDSRVRLFRKEMNQGLAITLNFLLKNVLSELFIQYIARMDADDISASNRIEKQVEFLLANPEISCIGSWVNLIDESGHHISDYKLPERHEDIRRQYYFRSPFVHPTVMFRRSFIEYSGYYPEDTVLMEDNALWANALKNGMKLANLPHYLLKFRMDRTYYRRRSGFYYGWNYIKTRFKINRSLRLPFWNFLISLIVGVIKMMPTFVIRIIYFIRMRRIKV